MRVRQQQREVVCVCVGDARLSVSASKLTTHPVHQHQHVACGAVGVAGHSQFNRITYSLPLDLFSTSTPLLAQLLHSSV